MCAKVTFQNRKLNTSYIVMLNVDTVINETSRNKQIPWNKRGLWLHHVSIKGKIKKESYMRIPAVLISKLIGSSKVLPLNSFVVLVVIYNFNALIRSNSEIRRFTCYKIHHLTADGSYLNLLSVHGGRGLIHFKISYKAITTGLAIYLDNPMTGWKPLTA